MLISYHWLKQFADFNASPKKLAEKITLNLVEVETITQKGDDSILEVENKGITSRADCFSQFGFAREAAAYFNVKFKDPLKELAEKRFKPNLKIPFSVEVKQPKLCYRYSSIVLTNVKVGPSPKWLKTGVENCGVRSINNIVDVTNYVMLELGQPLHAFDYDLLAGNKIIVRLAKKGERIKTLDGIQRDLSDKILVIADQKEPVAIAGIIGGAKAEISKKTRTVVLESANFDKINNRQAEKRLKLRTEASTRFEKGLDVNLPLAAFNRAVELLQKVADAQVASEIIDKKYKNLEPWKIMVRPQWINKFLGIKLDTREMVKILNRLQLKSKVSGEKIAVTIPTNREDLQMPADIAEEIARIYGYDNIPATPLTAPLTLPKPNPTIRLRKEVKKFLSGNGFSEILNPPFLGKKTLEQFDLDPDKHLKLINPLSVDQEYLRRWLVPSLVLSSQKNLRFFKELRFFEISRIFIPQGEKQPQEREMLSGLVVTKKSYLKLKGTLEGLFEFLGIKVEFKPMKDGGTSFWQKEQTTEIISKISGLLGKMGQIKETILRELEIKDRLSVCELDFVKMVKSSNLTKTYQAIHTHPPIIEDLTFVVKPKTYVQELIQLIKECSLLIQSVELVDSYKNSRTVRVTYQHPERNLTDKEVKEIREKIIQKAGKQLGVKLKGASLNL